MGKLTFKIHPLFIIFGIYFAFTGKVFSFLSYTLCACIHECGHSLMAEKLGYKLKNVTLMPYGAMVSGDMTGMSVKEEIAVVVAGPCTNFLLGLMILALWWLFPETYPYTSLAAQANFALAFVNLIPAFPLDGGRLLLSLLSLKTGRVRAVKIAKILGIILSGTLVGLFVYSCFVKVNFSLLFFSLFVLLGVLDKNSADAYVRIFDALSCSNVKKSREIKELAVSDCLTVRKVYRLLKDGYLYRVYDYDANGKLKKVVDPAELSDYLTTKRLDEKIA